MNLIKWFKDAIGLEHGFLVTFTVFVFCCGIGIGLFLGLDSQEAEVKKLEARNGVLVQNLREQTITNVILSIRLQTLVDLMKNFVKEQEKEKDYNDGALE